MSSPVDTIVLLNAQTTDVNSAAANFIYANHKACVKAWGTWGGATIILQASVPTQVASNTWVPLKDRNGNAISFTANGVFFLEDIVYNDQIRAVQSSSSGSTSLSCTVQVTG